MMINTSSLELARTTAELSEVLGVPVEGRSIIEVVASRADLRELHARIHKALAL